MSTKDSILNAAVKIFSQKGFEQASVDEIAKVAKVAKGTLYYHFSSKEKILFALIERGIDDFTKKLETNLTGVTNPSRQLEIVIETQLMFFYEYKDFSRILLSEIWRFEIKWKRHIEHIQNKYLTIIKQIITEGIKQHQFNSNLNIEAATTAVFSLISFASLDWAIFHSQRPVKEINDTIKHIFFHGLSD